MEEYKKIIATINKGTDMHTYDSQTIKEIVTQNFRAASVFEKYSLDFCCKGGVTIADACKEKQIDPAKVVADLHTLNDATNGSHQRFNQWDVDFLTTYIISNHHEYVRQAIPALRAHTQKVASVHGERHPEMKKVADLFGVVANEMISHMHKEEHILFPYIITLGLSSKEKKFSSGSPFGTVRNPIRMMEQEHESAGSLMYEIRDLTGDYTIPGDACTTYRVTLKELQEFEHDLHQHVHLENNILFPKAVLLEEQLVRVR
ncbi:MAG: iron-sulfur cluster repair di-iron protein [Ignavibacteriales bacterium]|nr:iron-sulfur cluster repair di-iron protein [Ignavibacteriales bacterium]